MDNKQELNYFSQTRSEMLPFIPKNIKTVLDVGCGEGAFSHILKQNLNIEAWGIEYNKEVVEIAKQKLDKVINADIKTAINDLPNNYFDCLIFNDILEHLVEPTEILEKLKPKLTKQGVIVCSIPNVRHISVLKKLLINGTWEYEEDGILDKTHLRFFTKKSIIKMMLDLNYELVTIEGINPTSNNKFFPLSNILFSLMPDIKYRQFACVAQLK